MLVRALGEAKHFKLEVTIDIYAALTSSCGDGIPQPCAQRCRVRRESDQECGSLWTGAVLHRYGRPFSGFEPHSYPPIYRSSLY